MCMLYAQDFFFLAAVSDVREIGDVDEGVVERGEDACNSEDELACEVNKSVCDFSYIALDDCLPSRTCGPREMFCSAGRSVFFLGGMLTLCLVRTGWWCGFTCRAEVQAGEQNRKWARFRISMPRVPAGTDQQTDRQLFTLDFRASTLTLHNSPHHFPSAACS